MGAVIFAYIIGLVFFVNATAIPYPVLSWLNVAGGVWFVVMASLAGWQHFNRD